MKRIIAILLAAVLTVGMAFTAFAADSPTTDDGKIVVEATTAISEADVIAAAKALGINTDEYTVYFIFDIYYLKDGVKTAYEGSYTHTFDIGDATDAIVIHQHGDWKKLATTVSGKTASATFNGFSYGAVLVKKAAAPANKDSGKSPATGEAPFVAGLVLVAILAGAGVVVFGRRRSAE